MYWVFMCNRSAHLAPPSPSAVSRVACKTCRTQFSDSGRHPLLTYNKIDDAYIYGLLLWVTYNAIVLPFALETISLFLWVSSHVTLYVFKFIHCICMGVRGSFFFFSSVLCTYIAHRSAICTPVCASHLQPPPHQVRGIIILCSRIGLFDAPCLSSLPPFFKIISHNPLAHPVLVRHVFPHRMEHTQQIQPSSKESSQRFNRINKD